MTDTVTTPTTDQQPNGGYRVAFDVMAGIEPITFPADVTSSQITDRLRREFLAADVIDDGHVFDVDIDTDAGFVIVSADGEQIEHGSITRLEPTPDYWLTLADDLRQAADRIATLAGTAPKPSWVSFAVQMAAPGNTDPTVTEHVDTLAAAFGVKATAKKTSSFHEYGADTSRGAIRLSLYAYVPAPADPEKAALEARVAELEARLAEGGAR